MIQMALLGIAELLLDRSQQSIPRQSPLTQLQQLVIAMIYEQYWQKIGVNKLKQLLPKLILQAIKHLHLNR